jgi:hypothetical protein
MILAGWWRTIVVLLVVFSTLSARFAIDADTAIVLVSESSEEKSISESDVDSLAEIFEAVATPLDGAIRVAAIRLSSEATFYRLLGTIDDVSARGPPRV